MLVLKGSILPYRDHFLSPILGDKGCLSVFPSSLRIPRGDLYKSLARNPMACLVAVWGLLFSNMIWHVCSSVHKLGTHLCVMQEIGQVNDVAHGLSLLFLPILLQHVSLLGKASFRDNLPIGLVWHVWCRLWLSKNSLFLLSTTLKDIVAWMVWLVVFAFCLPCCSF